MIGPEFHLLLRSRLMAAYAVLGVLVIAAGFGAIGSMTAAWVVAGIGAVLVVLFFAREVRRR